MFSCSASSLAKMTVAGTYKNQNWLQNLDKYSHGLHDTSYTARDNCETQWAAVHFCIIKITCTGLKGPCTEKTQAAAPNKKRLSKLLYLIGKTQRCRRECMSLLPSTKKTGENLKKEKRCIAFLINERQQIVKFHSIWRSSAWNVFKAALPFSAIWCH